MNRRERFFSCIAREGWDVIPVTHHYGTPEFHKRLYSRLGVNKEQWHDLVDDVFDEVGPQRLIEPTSLANLTDYPPNSYIGLWGEIYAPQAYGNGETGGEYLEASYLPFADIKDPAELSDYPWPSPDWFDYSGIKSRCMKIKQNGGVAKYSPGSYDFVNNIARTRGVTQTLLDIGLRDPVFLLLLEKRFEFHYEMDRRVVEAAEGEVDVVHFG